MGQIVGEAEKMGKIVKYCNSCDEGFAEKFGFCPNCAAPLEAFAMNPVTEDVKAPDVNAEVSASKLEPAQDTAVTVESLPVYDDGFVSTAAENVDTEPEVRSEPPRTISIPPATPTYYKTETVNADEPRRVSISNEKFDDEDGYYVTVIQEKNVKQRNMLLLGSTVLMLSLAVGATIVSLFNKSLAIGAIGDDTSLASLIEDVPMVVEDKPEEKKKDKGGGGGGGGHEEKQETSQGDLADQQKNPIRPPDVNVHRSDTFELKMPPPSTEGDRKFPKDYNRWGDPNSRFAGLSNGTGSGGGQGSGYGTGQGSGNGTGTGSGSGSGSGGGNGNGNGDGDGDGNNRAGNPPPPPVGVSSPVKILSKPRAQYTDAGRTNQVQGSVRLKVALLASGQVGSITPVTRLPHGLTEQAIAAARLLKFEPKKINGVPVSTVQTIEYSFSIY